MKNNLTKKDLEWALKKLCIILHPFVPHISEEVWCSIGNKTLCVNESWHFEEEKKKIKIKIAVQINGKTREIIEVEDKMSKETVLEIIKSNKKINENLSGKEVLREIYVHGKIFNLVVK